MTDDKIKVDIQKKLVRLSLLFSNGVTLLHARRTPPPAEAQWLTENNIRELHANSFAQFEKNHFDNGEYERQNRTAEVYLKDAADLSKVLVLSLRSEICTKEFMYLVVTVAHELDIRNDHPGWLDFALKLSEEFRLAVNKLDLGHS